MKAKSTACFKFCFMASPATQAKQMMMMMMMMAEVEAREAKTAAFTAWSQADAQAMLDKVEEAKGSIGLMSGRFKKEELLGLSRLLPVELMPQIPGVERAVADVVKIEDDWVPNKQAKPVLAMLLDVATDACNFRASQSEPAAAASATAEK